MSTRSGFIVAGHGRLMAARKLGLELAPVDFQSFASDDEELAVLVSDNRIAELAETDEDELKALIKELDGQIDLDLTGFDAVSIEELFPPEAQDEDNPVPAPPDDPLTHATGSQHNPISSEGRSLSSVGKIPKLQQGAVAISTGAGTERTGTKSSKSLRRRPMDGDSCGIGRICR